MKDTILKTLFNRTPLKRILFFILVDIGLISLSLTMAFLFRFEWPIEEKYLQFFWPALVLSIATKIPMLYIWGCYHLTWMYVSVREIFSVLKACVSAGVLFVAILFFLRESTYAIGFPRSVPVLDTILGFILISGFRGAKRFYLTMKSGAQREGKKAVVVGAGSAGEQLVRSILYAREKTHSIVGFIDDHPNKQGVSIHGVKVIGLRSELSHIIKTHNVETVLIAIPSASSSIIRETVELARGAGVREIRTLPAFSEIISGRITMRDVRDIRLEDLLGRKPVEIHMGEMSQFFQGRNVMITGAGGSIGSEICRQLCRFRPDSLVLVDQDETGLFYVNRDIIQIGTLRVRSYIANVQDRLKMDKIMKKERPDIIFHSAAYKHVGMMEAHPDQAIRNNVTSTRILGELAMQNGVGRFVLISTDKAVNPTSVMGASKRVAELVIMDMNRSVFTRFMAVRFGNVLGSRGSVVPIFKEQIRRGGPITVTDPNMKRYFMITSEAVLLVFQAAVMGEGGEVFALDMGGRIKFSLWLPSDYFLPLFQGD